MNEPVKVLHVEHDEAELRAVRRLVEEQQLSWELEAASTLARARALLGARAFDVIVGGGRLPDGDPIELLPDAGDVPFLIITATSGEELALAALERGVDDYVVRDEPRHLAALAAAVRKAVVRRTVRERERQLSRDLLASEQRLRAIFDNAASGILQTDDRGRLVAVNDRVCQMLGYRREELLGMTVHDLTHPADRPLSDTLNARLREGQLPGAQFEKRYLKRDGSPLWVLLSISAVRDEAGNHLYSVGTVVDISARKAAEAEVRLHAAALDAAPNAVSLSKTDPHGTIVWVNRAFTRLTGYDAEEVVGRSHHLLSSGQQDDEFYRGLWETIKGGGVWRGELVNRRKDGTLYQEEMGITPLRDEEGNLAYYVAIKQDITVRKQAEADLRESESRFRALADAAPLLIWQCGPDRQCDYFNASWLEFTGRTMEQELGSGWVEGVHPDDAERCMAVFHEATDRREPFETEYRLRHRSGEYRWVLDRGRPRLGPGDQYLGYIGGCVDIDERRRAEEELVAAKHTAEEARAAAEEASRAKDHFLAVLSHELRTPLTPVLTSLSMLEEATEVGQAVRERLEMIRRNIELEARLIDDLLDVTRITRGRVDLDRRPRRLGEILRRAVEVVQPDIDARRLHFGITGDELPYVVDADAARLQQVFWNLLRNAIKFTPRGGCIGVQCRRGADSAVVVEVTDSGEGIEPEALPRIFNAFEQARSEAGPQFGGLGLGLAISKALVEMHDGRIEAASEGKGKGATFRVHLPLVAAAPAVERSRPVPPPSSRALRILLVEDHGDTAEMMALLLSSDGHRVERVGDVASALEAAARDRFDLLISDLGLPDASGLDLMRELRRRGAVLPAIALSGYGQEQDIRHSRDAGFSAHITKPANLQRLTEVIATIAIERDAHGDGSG